MVYEPDFDFSQALLNTNKLRVYPEMIRHIPFDTFYLDFSKNGLFEYEGFFVQVKVYDTGALRIVSLPTEKNYSNIPLDEYEQEPTAYADAFWIKPEMLDVENGICYFDFELSKDLMWTVDSYRTQWFIGGLSILAPPNNVVMSGISLPRACDLRPFYFCYNFLCIYHQRSLTLLRVQILLIHINRQQL